MEDGERDEEEEESGGGGAELGAVARSPPRLSKHRRRVQVEAGSQSKAPRPELLFIINKRRGKNEKILLLFSDVYELNWSVHKLKKN